MADSTEEKKLNLSKKRSRGSGTQSDIKKQKDSKDLVTHKRVRDLKSEDTSEEDNEVDDEVIELAKGKKSNIGIFLLIICAIVVVILFILFRGGRHKEIDKSDSSIANPANSEILTPQTSTPPVVDDASVGTQDFTKDTNRVSSSPLTDPDLFVEDLYGLTVRVDYTVEQIQDIADFVSYTKHRGTWGGGLELYYLDAEYKGSKYVVQVPFKYYKELDDVGIVPVKMEVLRIKNETGDGYLTVVSYMCLDEETLQAILKTQNK